MKYEEILRWRQEVYDATMLGLQARSNSSQVSYPSSASVKPREQNTRQDSWTSGDPIGAALQAPVIQKDSDLSKQDNNWPPLQPDVKRATTQDKERSRTYYDSNARLDRRQSLPLPGQNISPFNSINIPQQPQLTEGMTSIVEQTAGPVPVPASLAPAQGHQTPKLLKRPISASISSIQSTSQNYTSNDDTTGSNLSLDQPNYALKLNNKPRKRSSDKSASVSPTELHVATPRVFANPIVTEQALQLNQVQ